ncbi:hypothetical protein [Nonomuraea sp. NPDC049141]
MRIALLGELALRDDDGVRLRRLDVLPGAIDGYLALARRIDASA